VLIGSAYNAGPLRSGAALASFERIGPSHVPVGTEHRRLMLAVSCSGRTPWCSPSCATLVEWAAERATPKSASRVLVAGEPARRATFPQSSEGWGAQVTGQWASATSAMSLWGSAKSRTECTWVRAASSAG
jgi:phenylacetate-CoA ligase